MRAVRMLSAVALCLMLASLVAETSHPPPSMYPTGTRASLSEPRPSSPRQVQVLRYPDVVTVSEGGGESTMPLQPRNEHVEYVSDPARDRFERESAPALINYMEDHAAPEDSMMPEERAEMEMLDATIPNAKGKGIRSALRPAPSTATRTQRRMMSFSAEGTFRDDQTGKVLESSNYPSHLMMRDLTKSDASGEVLMSAWNQGDVGKRGSALFASSSDGDNPFDQQHLFTRKDGSDPMFPTLPKEIQGHDEAVRWIHNESMNYDRVHEWRQSLPTSVIPVSAEQKCAFDRAARADKARDEALTEEMFADYLGDANDETDYGPLLNADGDGFEAAVFASNSDPMSIVLTDAQREAENERRDNEYMDGRDPMFRRDV